MPSPTPRYCHFSQGHKAEKNPLANNRAKGWTSQVTGLRVITSTIQVEMMVKTYLIQVIDQVLSFRTLFLFIYIQR